MAWYVTLRLLAALVGHMCISICMFAYGPVGVCACQGVEGVCVCIALQMCKKRSRFPSISFSPLRQRNSASLEQ